MAADRLFKEGLRKVLLRIAALYGRAALSAAFDRIGRIIVILLLIIFFLLLVALFVFIVNNPFIIVEKIVAIIIDDDVVVRFVRFLFSFAL